MSTPFALTLIYPNGGEIISESEIVISWALPSPLTPDGRSVQIEIYFTELYDPAKEVNWQQIAVIPGNSTQFIWRPGAYLKTSKARIAIRSKNGRGERSEWSISAANFSIKRRKLATPALISPTSDSRWNKYIEIVPDNNAIAGTYSQRSFYQFYYSSISANIPQTPIAQNVPVGTDSILWNVIDLPPAADYLLTFFLEDDDGNVSDSVLISNINISHEGFFIIDTTPPVASIVVNNDDEFTNNPDVSVKIVAFDEATGVHSMQLLEGNNSALPEPLANVRPFTLSSTDGTKIVELSLQDFGANRNNQKQQRLFDKIININGTQIVDIAFTDSDWAISNGGGNYLYQIDTYPSTVYTFTDIPTALGVFNNQLYIATKSSSSIGTLLRYTGAETVQTINVFSTPNSVINCMIQYGSLLYIGMENGYIYSYDGATINVVVQMLSPAKILTSDGNSMYLAMKNDNNLYIFNGSTFVIAGV